MRPISRLYLNTCFLCSTDGSILCENCFEKYISVSTRKRCHVCNNETYLGFLHKDCEDYTYLDGLIYLTDYSELAKKLISLGKYSGYYSIYKEFGHRLVELREKEFERFKDSRSLVTAVPLHNSRFIERGFNQAELFGREVALNLDLCFLDILERTRKSKKQHALDKDSRALNLANLFKLKGRLNLSKVDQIFICDDIYTTGKTLNECAKAIREVFTGKVYGVVIVKV